jgi:uncharacterized cupredoxin-like copper-binding protein
VAVNRVATSLPPAERRGKRRKRLPLEWSFRMPDQRVLIAVPALALAVAVAGCGTTSAESQGDPPAKKAAGTSAGRVAGRHLTVAMTEYRFKPSSLTVRAGRLHVTAKNDGHQEHEFVLIRSSRPAAALRTKGKEALEAGSVGEISERKPGTSGTHAFNLKPGRYVFICNVPGHYRHGMRGTLTVR